MKEDYFFRTLFLPSDLNYEKVTKNTKQGHKEHNE